MNDSDSKAAGGSVYPGRHVAFLIQHGEVEACAHASSMFPFTEEM